MDSTALLRASLDDKYTLGQGRVFLTGTQALIRLMMLQRARDQRADVFKPANAAGTAKRGGVLVLAGDDHAAKSSTLPHQSEHIFKACLIPVLNPSNVQDYLDLGLHGIAMSRYSGLWVAFKCVTDVVESGASVLIDE